MSVQVKFSPDLSDESTKEEAMRLSLGKAMEEDRLKIDGEGSHKRRRRKSITAQASPLVSSFASVATPGSQNYQPSEGGDSKYQLQLRKIPPPEKG